MSYQDDVEHPVSQGKKCRKCNLTTRDFDKNDCLSCDCEFYDEYYRINYYDEEYELKGEELKE